MDADHASIPMSSWLWELKWRWSRFHQGFWSEQLLKLICLKLPVFSYLRPTKKAVSFSSTYTMYVCVCVSSVVSNSLWLHGLKPAAPLSMEFSRQEYWSGLPFPTSEDLPDPGIKPMSLASPALAGGFFITSATCKALGFCTISLKNWAYSPWNPSQTG